MIEQSNWRKATKTAGKQVVIVGAVALGPKVACCLKRLQPNAEITVIDQDEYLSYGDCGKRYFISADVGEVRELMSTSFNMVRTPQFLENANGVHFRTGTRALAINRQAKCVKIQKLETGEEDDLPYDQLVLATGSRPNRLPIPGIDHRCVMSLANLHAAIAIKERIARGEVGGETMVRVITSRLDLGADLVITAVGVRSHSELARQAGSLVSPRGAIAVNHRLQTSDPNICAGRDCIETMHLVTGKPLFFAQGSLANRQGRVIGTNVAGGFAAFNGVVESFAIKIFDLAVASTGIPLHSALREGFEAAHALVVQADRAHFYPEHDLIYLHLVIDRKTRRLLGAKGLAHNGDALVGRINSIAAMLPYRATLDDLSKLEVAYSPPFASALDIVNAAANTAENILDGCNRPLDATEFKKCFLEESREETVCLDVRGPNNAAPSVASFGERWLNIPQKTLKQRLQDVPKDKRLIVACNSGARSYEALRQLEGEGLSEAMNLQVGRCDARESRIV